MRRYHGRMLAVALGCGLAMALTSPALAVDGDSAREIVDVIRTEGTITVHVKPCCDLPGPLERMLHIVLPDDQAARRTAP